MRKSLLLLSILMLANSLTYAQLNRYLIKFTNKGNGSYTLNNPGAYLSQKAIERRQHFNISIDSTDLPISTRYLDSVRLSGTVTIISSSKWLNQIAIFSTDATALAKIQGFPFVEALEAIANKPMEGGYTKSLEVEPVEIPISAQKPNEMQAGQYSYGTGTAQVRLHQGEFLHNLGFNGSGMQIAVLDAGFYHYETLPAFDSVRINNQILGTWDFVRNEESVNEDHYHGMMCLSSMAANIPGQLVGTAPGASYYLYRTEEAAVEYPIEEHNWVAALEKADSLGVEVSSTSLGYTTFSQAQFNHTYADMDGKTTMAAKGANLASKKGMLVIVAAGNEGNTGWHFISTPADADSALTVGAVDSLGNSAAFSGYGPSSDGEIKPNVAAVGWFASVSNTVPGPPIYVNGTSFACPNLAGLVTSLYQAFPEFRNRDIINALEQNASQTETPDNRVGFGIPDMKKAFVWLQKKTFFQESSMSPCTATFTIQVKAGKQMKLILLRKKSTENNFIAIDSMMQEGDFVMQNYIFQDAEIQNYTGEVAYRIDMKIGADTSFILDSVLFNKPVQCPTTQNQVSLAPNPVQDVLHIKFERTTNAVVHMETLNQLGQRISISELQVSTGVHTEQIKTRHLAAGVYFIKIQVSGEPVIIKQFIKI